VLDGSCKGSRTRTVLRLLLQKHTFTLQHSAVRQAAHAVVRQQHMRTSECMQAVLLV